MVCSVGSGRMAVISRLLAAGSFSQTTAEEIGQQKSAAAYICRELREADEANLLDEEDMHVYGLKPMSDTLQLVRCNACKKPIEASQYAAHADQATAVSERGKSEAMDSFDIAVPQSLMNSQTRVASFSNEAKDAASMMDGTGISLGNRDHPASVMQPPTKRHKLIAGRHLPLPESPVTEFGVTRSASFANKITCKGGHLLERAVSEHGDPNHKNLELVEEQLLMKRDFPAPLATKMYYSQRNNRLRAALRDLYFQEPSNELCTDVATPNVSNEMIPFQDSSQRDPSFEQKDNELNMESKQSHLPSLTSAQSPNHILVKSSDIYVHKAEGLPTSSLSNQFLVNNVSRSAATPLGFTRSNFLPKPYSFASNTGNPLGTIQQPKGSVPVI